MIPRDLAKTVVNSLKTGFVCLIYGARRVGKTVLLEQIKENLKIEKTVTFNGDTEETRTVLNTSSEVKLTTLVRNYDLIFIDEAQRIPGIGLALKIVIDKFPQKKIIVTGSSSLELAHGMHETLTGRNISFVLYPLSTKEMSSGLDSYKLPSLLPDQLLYGGYPYLQSVGAPNQKQTYLHSIVSDYLFRDLANLQEINNADALKKIAALLAFQIGSEVSFNELSKAVGIDIKTVARYINLLEKSFVIFSVGAYSTNLRKEISKSKKYYFYDLGIRNALVDQFLPLDSRTDIGALWENFLFVERKKKLEYVGDMSSHFFWRNYLGAEVDLVEMSGGKIKAFKFKWTRDKAKTPKAFLENYGVKAEIVCKDNYLDFVCDL